MNQMLQTWKSWEIVTLGAQILGAQAQIEESLA